MTNTSRASPYKIKTKTKEGEEKMQKTKFLRKDFLKPAGGITLIALVISTKCSQSY